MATFNHRGVSPAGFIVGSGGVTKDTPVKLDSAGSVVALAAITDEAVGVALSTESAAGLVAVQSFGRCRGIASAAIAAGAKVMWTTGGKLATASGATAKILGVALEAAAADGDVIAYEGNFPSVTPLGS